MNPRSSSSSPHSSAPRPYDSIPIPSVEVGENLKNGLNYQLYNISTPWVPDISSIKQNAENTGIIENFDIGVGKEADNFVIEFTGFLSVTQTGEYTFSLKTDGGAVMRLHDAAIIDADKAYTPGSTVKSSALLQKGYHPIKLTYKKGTNTNPDLQLSWAMSDFPEQPISANNLFH